VLSNGGPGWKAEMEIFMGIAECGVFDVDGVLF